MKPKLTLRDLFWLVLVCAMGLRWAIERQRLLVEIQKLEYLRNDLDFSFTGGMDGAFYSGRK